MQLASAMVASVLVDVRRAHGDHVTVTWWPRCSALLVVI